MRIDANTSDVQTGLDLMGLVCPDATMAAVAVIQGPPKSKARARQGRNGGFYAPDKAAQEATAWAIKIGLNGQRYTGSVVVGCLFFRPNLQRIDVDNMMKHVLDAATGVAWNDDSQVVGLYGWVHLDPDRPRTIFAIGDVESTMNRERLLQACEKCGEMFHIAALDVKRRFCSRECAHGAYVKKIGQDLSEEVPCPSCAKPFRRRTASMKFCSPACAVEAKRGWPRGSGSKPVCSDCGNPVSKPGYVRCRACWKVARSNDKA